MSGPKVVNIQAVRRQMQRQCAARLRDLSAALEDCLNLQRGDEAKAAALRERAGGLLTRLEEMQAGERYTEALNEAASYRDFYAAEARSERQRIAGQRTAELRREHRRRQLATQLRAE